MAKVDRKMRSMQQDIDILLVLCSKAIYSSYFNYKFKKN